jgi:hypothetical protein
MRRLLPLLLVLPACAFPQHEARTEQEFRIPLASLSLLDCLAHNGDITVTGADNGSEIVVHAELRVRGWTPEDARANLDLLTVVREIDGQTLKLSGHADDRLEWNMSPSFAFTITAPAQLGMQLTSHNGAIAVHGLRGPVTAESHNGSIAVQMAAGHLALTTHNGGIRADVQGQGQLDGTVITHNGTVDIRLADGVSTSIVAQTHNGSVQAARTLTDLCVSDSSLTGRLGDGRGQLQVSSHNGDVTIR